MNDLEQRQRRLDRAWVAIRFELFVAIFVPILAGLLVITAPGFMDPMFSTPSPPIGQAVLWLGGLGYVLGLAWMIRLSRPRVEAGERDWRYRDV